MMTLEQINRLPATDFVDVLGTIFEHSPWVPEAVAAARPFTSVIDLHSAMCGKVLQANPERQMALISAHPELAGRAAIRGDLTAASTNEQQGAGLAACSAQQYADLQRLNSEYRSRFGFPFILAVKGHTVDSIIARLADRVAHDPLDERSVALQEICRIARFRLADLIEETLGGAVMAMVEELATISEQSDALTCSYLTPAHLATASKIRDYMLAAGLAARIDAVGNVVGVLDGDGTAAKRLLTGSHYDTVINAGKFDGRLGVVLPIAVAAALRQTGERLPFTLEIIAFAEEEGVRFKSTFLGSGAIAGRFDPALLDVVDADGVTLREAIAAAGHDVAAIPAIARDPNSLAGFIEVHIEQGPVLLDAGLSVGVVTSIAGSMRSIVTVEGLSGHAGTVPMNLRRDAAVAAAEIVLAVEARCRGHDDLVGTVGKLEVPGGAVNVIPGRCVLSIDLRSGVDALLDAADADLGAAIDAIAARRGVTVLRRRVLAARSVPCAAALQESWAASIERITGRAARRLPSGAGHDAMMMAGVANVGMLFVRCGNGGISHHPLEALSESDADLAARVFLDFLRHYEE